jgi:GT2 family glycosyltransferase
MTSIEGLNNKLSEIKLLIIDSSNDFLELESNKKWNFDYEIIRLPRNMGFAHACNIGIRMASCYSRYEKTNSYIWLINPDTNLHTDSLNQLKIFSRKDTILGSLITQESFSQDSKIWGAGGFIDKDLNVSMKGYDEKLETAPKDIFDCDYIPGCSVFFNSELINENFIYIPEIYFLYFEETEWCLRLKNKGMKLKITPSSLIEHSGAPEKMASPFRVYFYNRNNLLFKLRNLQTNQEKLKLIIKSISEIPKLIWKTLKEKDPKMKLTFKAHLLAKTDSIKLFLFSNSAKAANLSRKRLSSFLEVGK